MPRELKTESLVEAWVNLYQQLLALSKQRLNCVEKQALSEDFSEQFEKWNTAQIAVQEQIIVAEQEIKQQLPEEEWKSIFATRIQPTLEALLENSQLAERAILQSLQHTGKSIQSNRDHKHAMKAYYGVDQEGQEAIFFDEKK